MTDKPIDFSEPPVDLSQLLAQFYPPSDWNEIGSFDAMSGDQVPVPYRKLLDHHSHMTVAVESHFASSVDVTVVSSELDNEWYAREILLTTQSDERVVQYGIVRLKYGLLAESVWNEIRCGLKPLGRVLIEHDVLRQVELVGLWKVACGPVLARHFSVPTKSVTYGRTARIFCDSEPAIELLEIIRPGEPPG